MSYNPEQPVFETEVKSSIKLHYGIEDRPKTWWETLFYAWQITLVDFTPFIWAGAFVSIAGLPEAIIPVMISACFLAMGVGTILQTTIGNRLPIVQGPSSSVLTAMGGVTAIYGFPAMWGAVIIGGFVEYLIGVSRILGKIRNYIPPVVTGSVVTTIGFVAARIAIGWMFSKPEPLFLFLAILAFVLALFLKFKGKGIFSQGFVLISVVIVGVILATILGAFDWAKVAAEPWFAMPKLFPFKGFGGDPKAVTFVTMAIIGGFTGYIGSIFESIGDYAATCAVSDEVYRVKHINKGIAAEGLGCVASGFIGALPVTSYTQNIGIIAATGIASRFITQIAAIMFLLYGLSPKLAMLLACIPRSVVGGVFLISASLIMFSGIEVILSDKQCFENNLIAGTTIAAGVMLPVFASTNGAAWVKTLSAFPRMYMNNNVFIAVSVGVVMNLLVNHLLKQKEVEAEEKIE